MIKSIKTVKVSGKRVILRAGFDVPLEKNIHTEEMDVVDDSRIRDILATLRYLIQQKAKIVIISHLGRPDGQWMSEKSLKPVAKKLSELLDYKFMPVTDKLSDYDTKHVYFLESDITKKDYSGLSQKIGEGEILFLENLRFYAGEEANDEKFVKVLISFGEVFVNDAFSVAHRKEASTFGIAKHLPSYAGISLAKEISGLSKITKNPQTPLIVMMGGAKIVDKIDTIHNLAKHAEYILLGGALANSFLKAKGYEIGKSKFADLEMAKELLRNYKTKIILPVDVVVSKSLESQLRSCPIDKVMANELISDIGPETIRLYATYIKSAKTLIWNGPFGLIEYEKFSFGSLSLSRLFAARSKGIAYGVVGGGETLEMIDKAKVGEFIDHISMGGGAMLEFLAGKTLPGIKVLEK